MAVKLVLCREDVTLDLESVLTVAFLFVVSRIQNGLRSRASHIIFLKYISGTNVLFHFSVVLFLSGSSCAVIFSRIVSMQHALPRRPTPEPDASNPNMTEYQVFRKLTWTPA